MQRVNIFVQRPQMFFNKTKYIGKTFPALLTQFIAYFLCVSKLYREVAILVECTQIYTVTVTQSQSQSQSQCNSIVALDIKLDPCLEKYYYGA